MKQSVGMLFFFLAVLTAPPLLAGQASAEPSAAQIEFFEKKIRPMLAENCYSCHSLESKKSKGSLLLDSRVEMLKGGDSGPSLVPGDPDKSLIFKAVNGSDADLTMPPKGKKLSPEQVADLKEWIKMGAPVPAATQQLSRFDSMLDQAKAHWAFQPVKSPEVPKGAASHPVDAFVHAGYQTLKLKPAATADKRSLIRRAYFDLHGLPPAFEEVAAFVADASPDAYAKLIDRLLASPRYGERWGRHWLDVARYADTMGAIYNGEDLYPHAYSYRDYVIRAFNDDMPYDQFLQEQIAGDYLVKEGDNRPLAAMGFLTAGRRKDRTVDDEVYDDRIDVLTRGVMGLTVACARCHDHKLEPIPSRDYYSLYAVLRSSKEPGLLPELRPNPVTPEYTAFTQERETLRKSMVEVVAVESEKAADEVFKRVGDYLLAAYDADNQKPAPQNKVMDEVIKGRKLNEALYARYVDKQAKWYADHPAVLGLWKELSALKKDELPKLLPEIVTRYINRGPNHPHLVGLLKETPPKEIKDVAAIYTRLFCDIYEPSLAAGQPKLKSARSPLAEDADLSVKDLEGAVSKRVVAAVTAIHTDVILDSLRKVLASNDAPTNIKPESFRDSRVFNEESIKLIDKVAKAFIELDNHAGAPARAMSMLDGKVYDGNVFIRGNPQSPGEPAPRQFIQVLRTPDSQPFPKTQSGRLELAKAIASKDNPLTARVFVNRVWAWHFGDGIVRTPSDFGFRGEKPTHPQLLDYLTHRFVTEGWSVKKLHRVIMLSATYQQSSSVAPEVVKADPENKFLARMNGRVLEFEAFRDAQLSVAGRLLLKEGGRPVVLSKNEPSTLRRTVYGLVDRKLLPNLYRSFDFPDPNFSAAKRSRSALTPQALFLLNSSFAIDNARALTEKIRAVKDKPEAESIRNLFRLVLQREASEKEVQRAIAFLAQYPKDDIVRPEATDWQYGRGTLDISSKSVTAFTPMAFYTGKSWQMAQKAPDKLEITAVGGETGNGGGVGAIRRWIAPLDGKIKISGELEHGQADSKGIVACVVLKGTRMLGEWKATMSNVSTSLEAFEVKKGDTLDFVVVGEGDASADKFQWAPTITMLDAEMPGMPGMPRIWDAKTDFMDVRKMPKPIGPWEELAQVLLLSNEFMFVD